MNNVGYNALSRDSLDFSLRTEHEGRQFAREQAAESRGRFAEFVPPASSLAVPVTEQAPLGPSDQLARQLAREREYRQVDRDLAAEQRAWDRGGATAMLEVQKRREARRAAASRSRQGKSAKVVLLPTLAELVGV